ncbi:hypothetical protein PHSY_006400 [Pseudozyma hubeiensis SY62]|uniref:Peptidase C15, pyroglutamyl peptidase I-like protein n=1 Tax=Pseudozyma hubeiensis (strain SY62) TaxID=1305764 RepID=R9PL44_PSEHS|nr:hypothetical protein PHSY_006400 [Pseudozyma hubeiensis SY62]GAC98805.1 hypothetical protein PHSY_006400 [Pseudozyma hubeiensis SY62]
MLDLSTAPDLTSNAVEAAIPEGGGGDDGRARIQTLQIPVHYGSVLDVVPRIHGGISRGKVWNDERLDPEFGGKVGETYPEAYPIETPGEGDAWDVVIHVGVGRQGSLRCETQAHKLGYSKPDANDQLAPLLNLSPSEIARIPEKYLDKNGQARGFGTGYEEFGEIESTRIGVSSLIQFLKQSGMQGEEVDQSFDPGRYLCDFVFYCSLCEAKRNGNKTLVLFVHVPPKDENLSVERCTQAIRAVAWYMAREKLKC